jgi:hypothetical protein
MHLPFHSLENPHVPKAVIGLKVVFPLMMGDLLLMTVHAATLSSNPTLILTVGVATIIGCLLTAYQIVKANARAKELELEKVVQQKVQTALMQSQLDNHTKVMQDTIDRLTSELEVTRQTLAERNKK